jgi:hypothetical protein
MSHSSTPSARAERWQREDDAPRLADQAPQLKQLRLEMSETFEGRRVLDSNRIGHIIVARAAARFEVPCSDARCKDGGHDLTREVMINLRQQRRSFVGQDQCSGYVGERPCARVLEFVAHAEFDAARA